MSQDDQPKEEIGRGNRPISAANVLKDLQVTNGNESTPLRDLASKTKPYIAFNQNHLERWVSNHGEIHRPFEFTFDTANFICDP